MKEMKKKRKKHKGCRNNGFVHYFYTLYAFFFFSSFLSFFNFPFFKMLKYQTWLLRLQSPLQDFYMFWGFFCTISHEKQKIMKYFLGFNWEKWIQVGFHPIEVWNPVAKTSILVVPWDWNIKKNIGLYWAPAPKTFFILSIFWMKCILLLCWIRELISFFECTKLPLIFKSFLLRSTFKNVLLDLYISECLYLSLLKQGQSY